MNSILWERDNVRVSPSRGQPSCMSGSVILFDYEGLALDDTLTYGLTEMSENPYRNV